MRRRSSPTPGVLVATIALVVLAVGAILVVVRPGDGQDEGATAEAAARRAAEHFLATYVDPDGRVVRRDQGGDTVSEGQAYAMLLAAAIGDRERFDRTWGWAREHLRGGDGLLAYRWGGGRVLDPQSASDADLDAARALVVAGRRFEDPTLTAAAVELATAIAEHQVVHDAGAPVLVAGPWALVAPRVVNVSYFAPRAYDELAVVHPSGPWSALGSSSRRLLRERAQALPPDWGVLEGDGTLRVADGPTGAGSTGRWSYEAVRVPVRYAEACAPADVALAAALAPVLAEEPLAVARRLDGSPEYEQPHTVALVGAAAASWAGGDVEAGARLLDQAEARDQAVPTYYGAAWVALARVQVTTDLLGPCLTG